MSGDPGRRSGARRARAGSATRSARCRRRGGPGKAGRRPRLRRELGRRPRARRAGRRGRARARGPPVPAPPRGSGFAPDRQGARAQHVAAVESGADALDGHADGVLAVIHRPERGLLAAVVGQPPVVDADAAQCRQLEQCRAQDRAAVDGADIGAQRLDTCQHLGRVQVGRNGSGEPARAGAAPTQLAPRREQRAANPAQGALQQERRARASPASHEVPGDAGQARGGASQKTPASSSSGWRGCAQ
jgi:hypothetical protein